MAEQVKRTIGGKPGPKIGGKKPDAAPAKEEAPAADAPEKKKGGLKKILLFGGIPLAVLGIGFGAFMVLKPDTPPAVAGEVTEVAEQAEKGEVVTMEPVSVNLAGSRYLRLGFALQLTAEPEAAPDMSHARDIGISFFSGREMAQVNDPATRDAIKGEFLLKLQEAFGAENVMDVYYTDFVTQ